MLRPIIALVISALLPLAAAELKVAVLHPLLGDLARQVGGEHVEVIDLIGPNGDPHHFEPNPEELKKAEGAAIYFVAGMGLEGYLPKLEAIIANQAKLIEVGKTLPTLNGNCQEPGHDHRQEIDPHWWHSIALFQRALGTVTEAVTAASPAHAADFARNAEHYRQQLEDLQLWSKREISKIPRDKRHLATAHAAFNYFCKDFAFVAHPVQGLSHEQMPDPAQLAQLIADLKRDHVAAIFPEKESNPKILKTLTSDTGIQLGESLIADGTGGMSYVAMYRHNVQAIVKALSPPL